MNLWYDVHVGYIPSLIHINVKYEVEGSQGVDKYNFGNILKPVVSKSFMTELHCILNITEMSILFFQILA